MIYLTEEDFSIARANGISYMNAYNRVYNCGWSVEEAIHTPVKKKEDQLWPKYKDLATQNGISQATFYARIKRLGMPLEKAATMPILSPKERYKPKPDAKITQDIIKQAEANGIGARTLMARVYVRKWDIEKAINTPVITKHRGASQWNT